MKVQTNSLKEVILYYKKRLNSIYSMQESKNMLWSLIEHYFGYKNTDLIKNQEIRLSESDLLKIHFAVKDLLKHKPLQYIIGRSAFFDLEFEVNSNTLIPRPETEEMVRIILKDIETYSEPISLLDIGTGSACIPISLMVNREILHVYALDVSEKALQIAKKNAINNGVDIQFLKVDILNEEEKGLIPNVDIIVSNPPYVRNAEKKLMRKNVLDFEPQEALFVSDEDPLIFYRKIAHIGRSNLKAGGKVYFEINEAFGNEIINLLEGLDYKNIQLYPDFHGKDRIISACMDIKKE